MSDLLTNVLDEHGIRFERHENLYGVTDAGERNRVVGLLRQVLSEPERQAISVFKGSGNLSFPQPQVLDDWWRIHQTDWFGEALEHDRFAVWFQPIVDACSEAGRGTAGSEVLAHECLIRLNFGRAYDGAEIVDAARIRNDIHAFDSYARRLSIRSAARQPASGKYFINFIPSSIYNPESCMKSTMAELDASGLQPEDIVFEIVESNGVRDSAHLRRICDYCRRQGFGIALDNVGTGSNSLQMMYDLRPDYIKLDKSLVMHVERPTYAATVGKLVELALRFGSILIAQGVEREQTMENLLLLGVRWMQGYLFGRPSPQLAGGPGTASNEHYAFSMLSSSLTTH